MRGRRGFTLTELLVVIMVIGVLAGLLLPALWLARRKALEKQCMNNLRQINIALINYRDEHMREGKMLNARWLSDLKLNKDVFICPIDSSKGMEGGKPSTAARQYALLDEVTRNRADLAAARGITNDQFVELDEETPDRRWWPSSYMYEFNMAVRLEDQEDVNNWLWVGYLFDTSPPPDPHAAVDLDGDLTQSKWGEVKTTQLRYGDVIINAIPPGSGNCPPRSKWHGYSTSLFPILRCFWHAYDPDTNKPQIFNAAFEGNFFPSGAEWEKSSLTGN